MRLTLMAAAIMLVSVQANASIEQQLTQCAATADKLDRLICYDKLAESVKGVTPASASTQASPATVATIAAPTAVAAAATAPQAPAANIVDDFGMEAKRVQENTVDKIYLEVQSITEDPYGAIKVTFTNGQVWKQTDGRKFNLKQGEKVYIEKAALGSFLMGTDERNAKARVKRLN
ncbi:type VI secretion protein [Shewanella septentrionalis]|uniref:Type VI secretion protein n=1 Tax=Shewanella septentrionalis TaxID=2952223 RepID=A0A9X3B394_9GAMM|nr:type VI secretion protein [Shewanella septentrionalis]MCT7947568.1 type VI secretion protein [Shewanella septentrionalis]